MEATITFTRATVKELEARLRLAIRQLNRPLIQQLSALLLLHNGLDTWSIAARVGVSTTTISRWRDAFLVDRWASLIRGKSSGRPPKLQPNQLKRLKELVIAGPEAAGYATGCWNAALVQALIEREFGKTFYVNYISTLLKNLGFSYQQARFVSDHLDEVARKRWRERQWPAILRAAKRQGALLLFADEASFAQWGSLGYTWALRGEQPVVKTTGKRKCYKVMGMVDYFSGRLFFEGGTGRLNATRYCAFLARVWFPVFVTPRCTDIVTGLVHDEPIWIRSGRTQAATMMVPSEVTKTGNSTGGDGLAEDGNVVEQAGADSDRPKGQLVPGQ